MTLYCPQCQKKFDDGLYTCPDDGARLYALSEKREDPLVGKVLDGRFRIDGHLSSGGMGAVYRATQISVNREVALKVLRPDLEEEEIFLERFFREARVIADLSHPNIVRLIDFGQDSEEGLLYLVMEMVRGTDMAALLREGRLRPELALEIAYQVCAALTEPHARGIVHRDLKPDNIILLPISDGTFQVKVLDFGIARNSETGTHLTQTGVICGTPSYMSPEQAQNLAVDARTDLYSLGVVLYEMLTGHLPFQGESGLQLLMNHVQRPAPRLSQTCPGLVPEPVSDLVQELMEKAPGERPQSAMAVRDRIKEIRRDLDMQPVVSADGEEGLFRSWVVAAVDVSSGVVPRNLVDSKELRQSRDPVAGAAEKVIRPDVNTHGGAFGVAGGRGPMIAAAVAVVAAIVVAALVVPGLLSEEEVEPEIPAREIAEVSEEPEPEPEWAEVVEEVPEDLAEEIAEAVEVGEAIELVEDDAESGEDRAIARAAATEPDPDEGGAQGLAARPTTPTVPPTVGPQLHEGSVFLETRAQVEAAQAYQEITGDLTIRVSADGLRTVELPNLQKVRGGVMIDPHTQEVEAVLPALVEIGGNLTFGVGRHGVSVRAPVLSSVGDNLIASSSSLQTLSLPALKRVDGIVTVAMNGQLHTFSLPALEEVGGLFSFVQNSALTTVSLSDLRSIGGDVVVMSSPITELSMDRLVTIGGGLTMRELESLEVLAMGRLRSVGLTAARGAGGLNINEMGSLRELRLSGLREVGSQMMISDAPRLRTIDLRSLERTGAQITLNSNEAVESVDLRALREVGGDVGIIGHSALRSVRAERLQQAGDLRVVNNPQMSECALKAMAEQLTDSGWGGQPRFHNNLDEECGP